MPFRPGIELISRGSFIKILYHRRNHGRIVRGSRQTLKVAKQSTRPAFHHFKAMLARILMKKLPADAARVSHRPVQPRAVSQADFTPRGSHPSLRNPVAQVSGLFSQPDHVCIIPRPRLPFAHACVRGNESPRPLNSAPCNIQNLGARCPKVKSARSAQAHHPLRKGEFTLPPHGFPDTNRYIRLCE